MFVGHRPPEHVHQMPMKQTMQWRSSLLALACALGACETSEARDVDPYAARMAVTPAPYNRAAAPKVTVVANTDSAPPPFTAEQATRGAAVYQGTCARCHAATQWQGGTFAAGWQGRRLSDFFDLVSTTMPQDNPGGLTQAQYVDVTAYVLQLGGFTSGGVALSADTATLRHVRLAIKPAPDSVKAQ